MLTDTHCHIDVEKFSADREAVLERAWQSGIGRILVPGLNLSSSQAVLRLVVEYPRELETQLDENALREYAAGAFEFHLVKRPQMDARVRLPQDQALGSLTPLELLELYWRTVHIEPPESDALQSLAKDLLEKPE